VRESNCVFRFTFSASDLAEHAAVLGAVNDAAHRLRRFAVNLACTTAVCDRRGTVRTVRPPFRPVNMKLL